MAKLTSMKMTSKERSIAMPTPADVDRPAYPYGLSLTLDDEALEKLDLEELPRVGTTLLLIAKVDVTSISEHQSQGDDSPHQSLALQITHLCLEGDADDKTVKALYKGAGE